MKRFLSSSVNQTHQLARNLAQQLKPGSILALYGELGSGKTTFTQGLACALNITKPIKSPTFTLMRQYPLLENKGMFYHLDLYRIQSAEDIKSLDFQELITEKTNIIAIEWPEKIESLLSPHAIKICFQTISTTTRQIILDSEL